MRMRVPMLCRSLVILVIWLMWLRRLGEMPRPSSGALATMDSTMTSSPMSETRLSTRSRSTLTNSVSLVADPACWARPAGATCGELAAP